MHFVRSRALPISIMKISFEVHKKTRFLRRGFFFLFFPSIVLSHTDTTVLPPRPRHIVSSILFGSSPVSSPSPSKLTQTGRKGKGGSEGGKSEIVAPFSHKCDFCKLISKPHTPIGRPCIRHNSDNTLRNKDKHIHQGPQREKNKRAHFSWRKHNNNLKNDITATSKSGYHQIEKPPTHKRSSSSEEKKRSTMNPQTIQETKRVLAVVDDLIEDVSILGLLPPYFSALPQSDMKRITGAFADAEAAKEVQSQLAEHYKTELRLESAAGGVTRDDIADHHLGTRALVDTLRQAGYGDSEGPPTAYQSPESVKSFAEILSIMRSLLRDRLNTTVEDDVVKFVILNDTVNREKTASADVQALNREVSNERESRKVEVEQRRQQIARLEEEIQRLRINMQIDTENAEKIAKEVAEQSEVKFANRIDELLSEDEKAKVERSRVERNNFEAERREREARSKRENELQTAINAYDKEMFTIMEQVSDLEKQREEAEHLQGELEVQLQVLGDEAEAHRIEKENDSRRQEHAASIEASMHSSACVIQAFIRSLAVRQAALNKNKKKKKRGSSAKK